MTRNGDLHRSPAPAEPDAHHDPSRKATALALAGYAALLALLFHRLFLGDYLSPAANMQSYAPFAGSRSQDWHRAVNDIQGDVWRQFQPFEKYQYLSAQQGRFPTWDPYITCGATFHGNGQAAMLYPFYWPLFLADPDALRGPLAALRLWVSAVAVFFLARRLGVLAGGAFLAGAAWMFSSFAIRWLLWHVNNPALWLPVLLVAFDAYLVRPNWRRFALASLAAGVLQLAGHPETQFHAGFFAGCFAIVRALALPLPLGGRLRRMTGCAAAMVVGLAVAAAGLLPFYCQLHVSANWHENWHAVPEGRPWSFLISLLAPDYFGRPRALHHYTGPGNYTETACWFGVVPLCLAVVAAGSALTPRHRILSSLQRRLGRFLTAAALVCLAVVLGLWPFKPIIESLPLFAHANSERLAFVPQVAGALLAGIGFDLVVGAERRQARRIFLVVLLVSAALLSGLFLQRYGSALAGFRPLAEPVSLWHHPLVRNVGGLALVLTALVGLAALERWERAQGPTATRWKPALVGLALLELFWVADDYNPTCRPEIADPPPPATLQMVIQAAGAGRLIGADEVLFPNLALRYGFRDVRGYDHPTAQRWADVLRRLQLRFQSTYIPANRFFPALDGELAAFFNRASVRYVYMDIREPNVPETIVPQSDDRPWPLWLRVNDIDAVYANPNAYPRAWFAETARRVDRAVALDALLSPLRDLRRSSTIEPASTDGLGLDLPPHAAGAVTLIKDEPEEVILETDSPTGGLVILNDRMDIGWSVTVDDQPAPPLYANFLFRGVSVPAGRHIVAWHYQCPGLRTGIYVSVATLVCLFACLAVSHRSIDARSAGP